MRITILQGAFFPVPPLRGGAVEKLWFQLGKEFSKLGHHVSHISRSFPGLPDDEYIDGVHHIRIKGYDTPSGRLYLKALDFLYSQRAFDKLPPSDILVTNTFWMPIFASFKQSRFGRIMVSVERMPKGQMRFYKNSCCLRACSTSVYRAINNEVPDRINMVEKILNPLTFTPTEFPSLPKEKVILFCCRMHPEKGISLLIESFIYAFKLGLSGWSLRLVGPAEISAGGGGEHWLESLIPPHLSSQYSIEWLGPIYDQDELIDHYQRSAIFVYPSLAEHGEALPVAPLEAMSFGAVPIVSNLECFQDYIDPFKNGVIFNHKSSDPVFELAQAIISLANCPERLSTMATSSRLSTIRHYPQMSP